MIRKLSPNTAAGLLVSGSILAFLTLVWVLMA
jgi:hypothetical protein